MMKILETIGAHLAQDIAASQWNSKPSNATSLREAAHEFEGFFISYLLKVMRETVPNGLLENKAGQMFYSFYDQEIGRLAAQAGGIGLGTMVEDYIEKHSSPTDNIPLKFSPSHADKNLDEAKSPTRDEHATEPAGQQERS